jgi:hypothetical protein
MYQIGDETHMIDTITTRSIIYDHGGSIMPLKSKLNYD